MSTSVRRSTRGKGDLPVLYPAFPFVLFAPLVVVSLDRRDSTGRPWFERLFRVPESIGSVTQRAHQLLAWIFGFNVMYAACLTVPLVSVRALFRSGSPYMS